jgi:hypothetical protein
MNILRIPELVMDILYDMEGEWAVTLELRR